MQPQDWAYDIRSPQMQSISIFQINRRHSYHLPPLITPVRLLEMRNPEIPDIGWAILPKALLHKETSEFFAGHKVRRGLVILCAEVAGDEIGESLHPLPAAKLTTAFRFVV
jgi:hypothetical protein